MSTRVTSARVAERKFLDEQAEQRWWANRLADMEADRRKTELIEQERIAHQEWLAANPQPPSLADIDNAKFAGRSVQFLSTEHGSNYGHVVSARRPDRRRRPNCWELRIRISSAGYRGSIDPGMCVLADLNDVKFID